MSDVDPVGWALLRVEEARALPTRGGVGFEQAQQAYRDALTVFRRETHPVQWYSVSLMLADLMAIGHPVDLAEPSLRQAVDILEELSSAPEAAPDAQTYVIATALRARALTELTGHDPASYEAACQAQRATAAAAEYVMPRVSADARLALAELLMGHGGRWDEVIAVLEQALTFYQVDEHPEAWLRCHWSLAQAYLTRGAIGSDDADLIRGVTLLDQAAGWARESGAPVEHTIKLAYDAAVARTRIRTDRRQNLEIAIEELTALLDQYESQLPAVRMAPLRRSLGIMYGNRIAGNSADNRELAIENAKTAEAAWDPTRDPDEWATVAFNMSGAYLDRIHGDRGENLEQAIAYGQAASAIRTREKDPALWAQTVHKLAKLYSHRVFGDPADNIEKSISLVQAALEVETREADPVEWADACCDLGNAFIMRGRGDRRTNLGMAITCYSDSLSVTSARGEFQHLGESFYGLGNALSLLGTENGDQAVLAYAMTAYEEAVAAFAELGSAELQAKVHLNRAMTLAQVPGPGSAARVVEALRQCLPTWDADHNPLRAPNLYAMLARFGYEAGQTAEAFNWISKALQANETLYAGATAEDSKAEMVADSTSWFLLAVDLALRSGAAPSDALLLAERGRTRMLREAVVRLQPDWDIPPELLAQEAQLMAARRATWEATPEPGFAGVQAFTEQLAGLWEHMRDYPGGTDYVTARKGTISWDQIRRWVDAQPAGFALLEYVALDDRVVSFVVRQGRSEPTVIDIGVDQAALQRCFMALYREIHGSTAARVRRETWDRLALPLVTLVQPELVGARLLCLIPHGLLHFLPLHALGPPGATLLDQMPVYYAPSAALAIQLDRGARRAGGTGGRRALVAGDSLGDLSYARLEAEQVGQALGVRPLIGEQATRAAVLAQLPEIDLAHFACHGYFRLNSPAMSAIVLADGVLTAGELQRTGMRGGVLILSGCDTGVQPVSPRTLDPGGLPNALIAAGARTAVGGLWQVNDQATQELFARFYQELTQAGAEPPAGDEITRSVAGCLRTAQLALRQTWPERYHWAPFIVFGSW